MTTTKNTHIELSDGRQVLSTARSDRERCWQYDRIGCKNKATDSVRLGNRVYQYCPEHPAPGVAR